jgi:hypothetical protein
MNMIISEYYSEDSSKTSFVIANPIGSTFRYKAQCMEQGYVVRVINFFNLSEAEDFAEDFVLMEQR